VSSAVSIKLVMSAWSVVQIALAYSAANEGCYSLIVPSRGETLPSTGCIA